MCVQLDHFSLGDWKDIFIAHVIIIIKIGGINLTHFSHIFPWLCAWGACYIIFCHLLYIRSGKTGIFSSLLLHSLWWVQIVRYVLVCRPYSFVCTLLHRIIIPENRDFVFIIIARFMMSANNQISFGLQIVFVCLYITPSQYQHCANLSEDIKLIKCLSDIFCRVCE